MPLLAAVAVVVLALSLLHPDPRPTNSAYTEACKFAGLYLGAVAAGTTGQLPALLFAVLPAFQVPAAQVTR